MEKTKKLPAFIRVLLVLVLAALAAAALGGIYEYVRFRSYKSHIAATVVSGMDASAAADGVYTGECDNVYIKVKVRVTVKDGKMTDIELLEHYNDRGAAAEAVVGEMLNQQRTDVDVIASATNSSITIEKAVENALRSARP